MKLIFNFIVALFVIVSLVSRVTADVDAGKFWNLKKLNTSTASKFPENILVEYLQKLYHYIKIAII